MQNYNTTADIYDARYSHEQSCKYKKAQEKVKVDGKIVLDAGCGSGLFFNQAAQKAELLIGVDVSRKLLLKAKERASGFANASVVLADVDHLPFRDGFFGVAFAFTVLQNMPDPKETLRELARVTKDGGFVVVTGLKKAFGIVGFMDVLEQSSLRLIDFEDDEALNCFVAVLSA